MVTMKRPTIKLLVVSICSYMLLFTVSSSPRAEEPSGLHRNILRTVI